MTTEKTPSTIRTRTTGRLHVRRGLGETTIGSSAAMTGLCTAHHTGRRPKARVNGNEVELTYPRVSLRRRTGTDVITLNSTLLWSIDVDGGVGSVAADLTGIALGSLRIDGGVARTKIFLPSPDGTLRVRFGAASRVTVRRPEGVPVRVTVHRGSSALTVDDESFGAVCGPFTVASPGFASASNRIDLNVDSADRLTVALT
jgi:hypothetical protein